MLESNKEKQETKKDMANKVEAWKTINSVLVKKTNDFMKRLSDVLIEKQKRHNELRAILEQNKGTSDENAEFLFLSGYIQCLTDIITKNA